MKRITYGLVALLTIGSCISNPEQNKEMEATEITQPPRTYLDGHNQSVLEIPLENEIDFYRFNYYIDTDTDGFADRGGMGQYSYMSVKSDDRFTYELIDRKASMKKLEEYARKGFLKPHEIDEVYENK